MAGEIHGQITREDAWRMWKPYGERVELSVVVDPDNLTASDAIHITVGSDTENASDIYYSFNDHKHSIWYYDVSEAMIDNPKPELIKSLLRSHTEQQRRIEQIREQWTERSAAFQGNFQAALETLVSAGALTAEQVGHVGKWLLGPDGNMFFQYTPLTQLELARFIQKYDGASPKPDLSDCTDFNNGAILSSHRFYDGGPETAEHNLIHEFVHASLSGTEIWDITRVDGWRRPVAGVIGHYAIEPSIEIIPGDKYSIGQNAELNEGWTEYIARRLRNAMPGISDPSINAIGYDSWADVIAMLHSTEPGVYRAITEAALVEAGPEGPLSKREALADMHRYADCVLGRGVLEKMLHEAGGQLTDIYSDEPAM